MSGPTTTRTQEVPIREPDLTPEAVIFGPSGDFRCPHRPPPMGTAEPADGGYVVTGTWDYCSGIAHATHFMGNARQPDVLRPDLRGLPRGPRRSPG